VTASSRRRTRGAAIAVALLLGPLVPLRAQAPKAHPSPTPSPTPEVAPLLKRYEEVSRPGAEHKRLDPLAGTWSFLARWHGADGKAIELNGTSENRWILGGRFLRCESTAEGDGGRVESVTLFGFDQREQRYFALAMQSTASYIMEPVGTYEAATRSFILSGKERDEITGVALTYRMIVRIEGPDRYALELFLDTPGRGPVRYFDSTFTRTGAALPNAGASR